jgi:ankyrin repeat protein
VWLQAVGRHVLVPLFLLSQVEMLLAAGADTELRSTDGSRADDWALRFGHNDCAGLIREHRESVAHTQAAVASALALSKYQVSSIPLSIAVATVHVLLVFAPRF